MYKDKKSQIAQNTQVKFYQYLYEYQAGFSKPEYKSIRDICRGILTSGSVIVNQIAQSLNEQTTVKKTAERFYRNLKHHNLHERLTSQLLSRQCQTFSHDTLIIVDESDLVKSHAVKMEGLARVRDGSKGSYGGLGYNLLNIVAYRKQENGYKMLPVSSDLVSGDCDVNTVTGLLHRRLDEITEHSGGRGVYVFDRGFDSRTLISHLVNNRNAFIIRGVGKRNVIIDHQEVSFEQVCKSIPLLYRHPGTKNDSWFECGIKRVSIRTHPHPKKNAPSVDVWLVKACHRNNRNNRKGYFYFLCDFPNQLLNEADIVRKVLSYYRLRWLIEQAHRQVKQDYGWEAMQLMTYTGLKNLNSILWLALCFLYAQKDYIIKWMEAYPRQFGQYRKRLMKLFEFVYTALMKAMKKAFASWSKYDYEARDPEPWQLKIRLI